MFIVQSSSRVYMGYGKLSTKYSFKRTNILFPVISSFSILFLIKIHRIKQCSLKQSSINVKKSFFYKKVYKCILLVLHVMYGNHGNNLCCHKLLFFFSCIGLPNLFCSICPLIWPLAVWPPRLIGPHNCDSSLHALNHVQADKLTAIMLSCQMLCKWLPPLINYVPSVYWHQ